MASSPDFLRWVEFARATPIGDVIAQRGIDRTLRGAGGRELVGPCPNCGHGKRGPAASDRFSINTWKNVWRCRHCAERGGDVIALVMWLDACTFPTACETLTGQPPPDGKSQPLDLAKLAEVQAEREARRERQAKAQSDYREEERQRVNRWWKNAQDPRGTMVEAYLRKRCVSLPPRSRLRFAPDAKLWSEKDSEGRRHILHRGPCMFAGIIRPDGRFGALHMTWIDLNDPDGKARLFDPVTGEFAPAKKVRGSQQRGFIDLTRTVSPIALVMGEGIETVLSARDELIEAGRDISRTAFWAAINLGNLGGPATGTVAHPTLKTAKGRPQRVSNGEPRGGVEAGIPIPDAIEDILLLGDGDSDPFATRLHLERAERRWAMPHRTIRTAWAPNGLDLNTARRRYLESAA